MAKIILIVGLCVALSAACYSQTETENKLPNEYYQAVAGYYAAPIEQITDFHDKGIADEDLPALFLISNRTEVPAEDIMEERLQEKSWAEIATEHGLKADAYYFMISGEITSDTYSPIFEKYSTLPDQNWDKIELSDEEIVNLVNLRFISSHYDYSVFEIMAMRDSGKDFVEMNSQVKVLKEEMIKKEKMKKKEAANTKE